MVYNLTFENTKAEDNLALVKYVKQPVYNSKSF